VHLYGLLSSLQCQKLDPYQWCIATKAGTFTNLPRCGKVVSTKVGCGRFYGKLSRVLPALRVTRGPNDQHDDQITRRGIILGVAASLICAPAIVRVTNLMPVRRLPFPFGPQSAGFVERLYLHALESHVGNLRADQTSTFFNGKILAVADACRHVAYGQAHGFLPPYVCIYRID
jgi:hypothetical protein